MKLPINPLNQDASRDHRASLNEGSAVLAVLIVMTAISLASASLLRLGVHETGINYRRVADFEVLNAVESAVEVASAYLKGRFDAETSVGVGDVTFSLSDEEKDQILASLKYVTDIEVTSIQNELLGSRIYIDPNDEENLGDPNIGRLVNISEWRILAEADVNYDGSERTVYATQTFQVRESPLFTHAIFYNMDLEFHPGPEMIISGPVHSNGEIWIAAKNGLYFKDIVSATGGIKAGMMQQEYQLDWSSMPGESTQNPQNVWFNTGMDEGGQRSRTIGGVEYQFDNLDANNGAATNTAERYVDARATLDTLTEQGFTNLDDYLVNNFSGMVLSGQNNAPRLLPLTMGPYVPDMTDDGIDQQQNSGYALIEPVLSAEDPSDPTAANPYNKGPLEREKFAFKSGITFEIEYSETGAPADNAVQLLRRGGSRSNPNDLTNYYVIPKKIKRANPHDFDSAVMATRTLRREDASDFDFDIMGTQSGGDSGSETGDDSDNDMVEVQEVQYEDVYIQPEAVDAFLTLGEYREDQDRNVIDGIYDRRRDKPHDLVAFDIGNFDEVFIQQDLDNDGTIDPIFDDGGGSTYVPSQDYNSIVYFEFPTRTPDPNREDRVVVAQDTIRPSFDRNGTTRREAVSVALSVENAARLPDPNRGIAGRSEGFTLATNSMMYVNGHFNADGDDDTGSSTDGDSAADTVAALAADAITILTPEFDPRGSRRTNKPDSDAFTEFNGAIITGLMPTNYKGRDGFGSGGSHNLPRFLEDWNTTFRYRGSMVVLFESEIAVEPWSTDYYGPPTRDWGFFSRFGDGFQPPGTPVLRTYHKLNFRYLTTEEYDELNEG